MKKIFLMGRSEAGKTSLTQALKGEELHYIKTQPKIANMEKTFDIKEELKKLPDAPGVYIMHDKSIWLTTCTAWVIHPSNSRVSTSGTNLP